MGRHLLLKILGQADRVEAKSFSVDIRS